MNKLMLVLLLFQTSPSIQPQKGTEVGQIRLGDGSPVPGVRVAAVPVPEANAPTGTSVFESIGQTDATGAYRLENVTPGRYYITAGLVDEPTYFPGVLTIDGAGVVTVVAGATVDRVDFKLTKPLSFTVAGKVAGFENYRGPAPTVNLVPRLMPGRPMPSAPRTFPAQVELDGTFQFLNVPAGMYGVIINGGGFIQKQPVIITLYDRDVKDVEIAFVSTENTTLQQGLEEAWSIKGLWSGIAEDDRGQVLHAFSAGVRREVDRNGKIVHDMNSPGPTPTARIAHFAADGHPSLLSFGTWSQTVTAFDIDGTPLWKYPTQTSSGIDDVWPVDLDGDNIDEVIVGFNGGNGLSVLNSRGQILSQTNEIGNVWHVSAGDVGGEGKPQVITTSARGQVHVFSPDLKTRRDLDPGFYANMVRVAKLHNTDPSATILTAGTSSGTQDVRLAAMSGDGTRKWSMELPAGTTSSVFSAYIAPQRPWLAVGLRSGHVFVVDADKGVIIATIDGQGQAPEIAWISGEKENPPLLAISTRTKLAAYRISETKQIAQQTLPEASTLRKQASDAARQRQSMQYVRELSGEVMLDGKPVNEVLAAGRRIPVQSAVGKQTVAVANPGKARVELELGPGSLMVSDGDSTWTYRPSTKVYTKIAAAQGPDGVAASLDVLDVMGFFEDARSAKTVREESVNVDNQSYDCWVVTSNVKIPPQAAIGGQISDGVMTSWIDKKSLVAVLEVIAYSYKVAPSAGAAPLEYQAKLKQFTHNLKIDQPIPSSVFAFTPPSDAKEQPAMVAGRMDFTGKDAASFKATSLDGASFSLESLKGKTVLLDFWASWCGPCNRSMPTLEKLHTDLSAKGLVILGVNVGESHSTVEQFLKTKPMAYPVIMGSEFGIPSAFGVTVFPTFVLIGPDGKVIGQQFGFNESALTEMASRSVPRN